MAVREQTLKQHQDIKDEFNRLSNVREYGVPKYSSQYILHKIADKYYKSAKTIENIVFNRTSISHLEPSQTALNLK